MSYEGLLYEVADGIATITLNRPEAMNALTPGMEADLHRAFDDGVGAARPALSGDEILARVARLTGREREVLGLLVNGQSNKMMARTLGISPRTVEFYRARIMDKMRTRNVTELVRLSAEAGIVPA